MDFGARIELTVSYEGGLVSVNGLDFERHCSVELKIVCEGIWIRRWTRHVRMIGSGVRYGNEGNWPFLN